MFGRKKDNKISGAQPSAPGSSKAVEHLKPQHLVNAITDGVIVTNSDGVIRLINPAAGSILGWDTAEATNLDIRSVFKITHEKDSKSQHPVQQVITTANPYSNPSLNLDTAKKNKTIVSVGISPILGDDNGVDGIIIIFRDVSKRRQQEQERSDFISTASHEMRTPVASIEGFLALAMNPKVCSIDDKARGYVQQAHDATRHLGKLFQDLLTSAKAEDGRIVSHPEPLEIGEFLDKLIEGLKFSAVKKGLEISYAMNSARSSIKPLYYVMVDRDRLEEVITNLFDNAVKYSDKGTITIGLTGDESTVQIFIKDQGIGIAKEDVPHLFQKFYRIDSSDTRTRGGTGLGLFICKQIIDLYGGRIWCESELGQGSTFYINLKRLSSNEAQAIKSGKIITPER